MLKKTSIGMAIALLNVSIAYAYSPIPLSPSWIKTTFEARQVAKAQVFRGKVVGVQGQDSLIVERADKSRIVVKLLHLYVSGKESPKRMEAQRKALQAYVGYTWYIRGDENDTNGSGVFLTPDGENTNLMLIYSGLYDLNTRSIVYTYDKKSIETKYQYMVSHKLVS